MGDNAMGTETINSYPASDESLESEHTFDCTFAIPTGSTPTGGHWRRSLRSPSDSGTTSTPDEVYFTTGGDAVSWAVYDGGNVDDTIPISSAQLAYIAANLGNTLSAQYANINNPGIISVDALQLVLDVPGGGTGVSTILLRPLRLNGSPFGSGLK